MNIAISVRALSVTGIVDGAWIRRSLGILELALVWRSTAPCSKFRRVDPARRNDHSWARVPPTGGPGLTQKGLADPSADTVRRRDENRGMAE